MSNPPTQTSRLNVSTFALVAAAIVVVLIGSSTLLVFGQEGTESFPSANNSKPSGLGAFAELLRRDGYKITVERDERPRIEKAGLVVVVRKPDQQVDFLADMEGTADQTPPIEVALEKKAESGATFLEIGLPSDFGAASKSAVPVQAGLGEQTYELVNPPNPPDTTVPGGPLLSPHGGPAAVTTSDKATYVTVNDGTFLTNRFLGQKDNARFALDLVRAYAPPGTEIVFAEAAWGNISNRTLLDEYGNWMAIAVWQFVLVVGVAVFAAGRRFGLPIPDRYRERGTNELLASMGNVLKRGRKYDQALMIVLDDTYERMRAALNAPLGTDPAELTKQAPAPLAQSIIRIRSNYGNNLKSDEWLQMSRALEFHLHEFETEVKSRRSVGLRIK